MRNYAFLFTGQGAQYEGMGKDLYEKRQIFKNVFDEASEHLKMNLIHICSNDPELKKTQNAQAAIFTMSYGIFEISQYAKLPNCATGFSLGEITSLAAAKILSFTDALDLIKIRGEIMQEACEQNPGSMYSVLGADDEFVEEVCATVSKTNGYVIPANYNCPGQIVISGEIKAVEKAVNILTEKKIRTIKLNVAGAFHSKLMQHKQKEFTDFLETLNYTKPRFDLYSNVTGKKFDFDNINNIKTFMIDYIPKQMSNPVRFREELENMENDGCDTFIEIGAGKTLTGLVKRTCKNEKTASLYINDAATLEAALGMFD